MMIAMFIILLFDEKIGNVFRYCLLFEAIGIVTNYVDFLTYPCITLGVPLVLFIILHEKDYSRVLNLLFDIMKISASWLFGYAAMWVGKWICATLFTDENVMDSVMGQARFHTSEVEWFGEEITRMGAVFKTLFVLVKWPYLLIGIAFCIWLFVIAKMQKENWNASNSLNAALAYIMVSIYPIIWFAVLFGHSYRCYWFTYREWGITAFALGSLFVKISANIIHKGTK